MQMFADVLKVPIVIVPIVNHDNNQHGANENVRLKNLWDGIELYGAFFARLGTRWP
jgi:acetylornithine deacetylase/succinyl-diaminopimelate desuccinylase-like protein